MMVEPGMRCGVVSILGAPNAGKSTLVNRLVGAKVSIVSPKVQTTRIRVRGVALIDKTQETVNGTVRMKLYKGNVIVAGRKSPSHSLFDESIATFEDDQGAYNQKDAHGFIRLNALRMRIAANAKTKRD